MTKEKLIVELYITSPKEKSSGLLEFPYKKVSLKS